jgi:hypothetical protein
VAIGIGASATVFGVMNQVWLEPPGYRDPNRLVLLPAIHPQQEAPEGYSSWDDFKDLRRPGKRWRRSVPFLRGGISRCKARQALSLYMANG